MSTMPQERRGKTREMIEHMLAERQEMLVLLWRVSGIEPYRRDEVGPADIQEFRQILVDYIAAAHFGLYERIVQGEERRKSVLEVAQQIYPRIAETTQYAVDFSDRYDVPDFREVPDSLDKDLSRLGELLASRIELEDQLIAAMLGRAVSISPTA